MRYLIAVTVMALGVSISGCGVSEDVSEVAKAKIEITDVEVASWYSYPEVFVTVKNTGENTAFWVVVDVTARDASGVIVDTGIVAPASFGDIHPGEMAEDSTIMFNLSMNDQFTLEYSVSWIDR